MQRILPVSANALAATLAAAALAAAALVAARVAVPRIITVAIRPSALFPFERRRRPNLRWCRRNLLRGSRAAHSPTTHRLRPYRRATIQPPGPALSPLTAALPLAFPSGTRRAVALL